MTATNDPTKKMRRYAENARLRSEWADEVAKFLGVKFSRTLRDDLRVVIEHGGIMVSVTMVEQMSGEKAREFLALLAEMPGVADKVTNYPAMVTGPTIEDRRGPAE